MHFSKFLKKRSNLGRGDRGVAYILLFFRIVVYRATFGNCISRDLEVDRCLEDGEEHRVVRGHAGAGVDPLEAGLEGLRRDGLQHVGPARVGPAAGVNLSCLLECVFVGLRSVRDKKSHFAT